MKIPKDVIFVSSSTIDVQVRSDNEFTEDSVIPAQAGIHPHPPLDAGVRRHDD